MIPAKRSTSRMERAAASTVTIFCFGLFEADLARNSLTRAGVENNS
jgi:hypothetical protein